LRKSLKILIVILAVVAIIIVSINFLFGYLIKTQIANFTNHNIELEYKSSKTRLLIGTIEFREAVLQFNDISIDSNSSIFIESLSFEKFAITRLNLKALLFERSFDIEKVLLSSPRLDFLKDTVISGKEIFSKILTPDVIRNKSKSAPFSFEIEEVEIESGSFELIEADKKDFSLGRINLKLSNIGMEDLKVLKGDDPDLNANFNIRLGLFDIRKSIENDGEIVVDSIVYKKDKRLFQLGGIKISQLATSSSYSKSEISVQTDAVTMNGFSLSHFLSSQDVKFNRLTISNPKLIEKGYYRDEKKVRDTTSKTKSEYLSNMINAFITDTLQVQNFNYRFLNTKSDSVDFIKNLNIWLYNIKVDSNFISNKEYLRPIERSTLFSGPISLHMKEYGFDMLCDSMVYSGPNQAQKFVGLKVNTYPPLYSDTSAKQKIKFQTDSLVISGLHEREWLDSSFVDFSISLANPKVYGSNISLKGSGKSGYPKFLPVKIILNEFSLNNGNIHLNGSTGESINAESISLKLNDFAISDKGNGEAPDIGWLNLVSEIQNTKFDIPGKLKFELGNGNINNNDFDFRSINYSENKIDPSTGKKDSSQFYASQVQVENFDLLAYLGDKQLRLDKLLIDSPEFYQNTSIKPKQKTNPDSLTPLLLYRRLNQKLPQIFSLINVKDFQINDAKVVYKMEQNNMVVRSSISSAMNNLRFEKDIFPEFLIDHYEFCITDVIVFSDELQLTMEEACYNSNVDNLILNSTRIKNIDKESPAKNMSGTQMSVLLPNVIFEKPDFTPMSGGPVSFHSIRIEEPHIDLTIYQNKDKSEKKSRPEIKVLPFTFLDENLILNNGEIKVCLKKDHDSTNILIGKLDLSVNNLYKIAGAVDQTGFDKNVLNYLDFNLQDVSVEGPGASTFVQQIDYNRNVGTILIQPIQQNLYAKADAPLFNHSISIPSLTISNPDIILDKRKIKSFGAEHLIIPTVDVKLESEKKEKAEKNTNIRLAVNDRSIRKFLGTVDFFHLDSTAINNIGIVQNQVTDTSKSTFEIERLSLIVDKLKIDSSHFEKHEKRLAKDIIIQLHDKKLVSADSLYDITINDITYYYSRDKIVVDSFEVIPRYEKDAFFEKAGWQTDRMQIKFKSAIVEGIDLISLIENQKLEVSKLTLDNFKLMDHRDQHYPRKENDIKLLPKQSLFNLPFMVNIDTVQVKNSFFLYGEYVDESPKPGELIFTNFNAALYNVSNLGKYTELNKTLQANIDADIMDEAKMNIKIEMPLGKNDEGFSLSGNVERTDLKNFNSMTENLFGISIVRGRGGVDIPLITASDSISKGTLKFEYKRLKLAMYNRDKAQLSRGLGSGLIDFMLNGVLVKSNNPTFLGKTRTGDVLAIRNKERSFFNYVWKSVNSGLMTTMGFYNKDLRLEKRERKGEERIELKNERQLKK